MSRRGRGSGQIPPVKDCSHSYGMTFDPELCFCEHCGQTWKMLVNRDTGDYRGWFPLPLHEATHGQRSRDRW